MFDLSSCDLFGLTDLSPRERNLGLLRRDSFLLIHPNLPSVQCDKYFCRIQRSDIYSTVDKRSIGNRQCFWATSIPVMVSRVPLPALQAALVYGCGSKPGALNTLVG